MKTRFLHVADVHLDSPLGQLKRVDEQAAEQLQRASRRSVENLVSLALEHQVAAVVIAGDLFDGPVKDVGAGLWVESQFRKLTRESIPVVLIRGNHDALSNARRVIDWSSGIHEFGASAAETLVLEEAGLAIHGQSFGSRAESTDLAAAYPAAKTGLFNIGLLHTSLSGDSQHDTYAPTTVEQLVSKGYDYWALGHIHIRTQQSLGDDCFIGYSGNTQGRHVREPGPKGCQLVSLQDGRLEAVEFLPTDSLRWYEVLVDTAQIELLSEIEDQVEQQVSELLESADGRSLAIRIRIHGASWLHAELTRIGVVRQLAETLAERMAEIGPVWIESVKIDTRPKDIDEHKHEHLILPMDYLRQVAEQLRENELERQQVIDAAEELLKKARPDLADSPWARSDSEAGEQQLLHMLTRAEDLLLSRLGKEDLQ